MKTMMVTMAKLLNYRLSYNFTLPLILSNITIDESSTSITQICYGVFLLSVIALFCLINIIGYMIAYILLNNKKDYIKKYPRLEKIVNYYKVSSLVFVSIEVILCFTCLLLLVIFSLLFIIKP